MSCSDLHASNTWTSKVGLGAYHTGVEIEGIEYSFSDGGILKGKPKMYPDSCRYVFKETIVLGTYKGTVNDFRAALTEMQTAFPKGSYDLLNKNCNSFSDAFSERLLGVGIPKWINRLANAGSTLSAVIPVRTGKPKPRNAIESTRNNKNHRLSQSKSSK